MALAGTIAAAMARVLIVDDHPMVRQGFLDVFEFSPQIQPVGSAGTAEEACRLVQELRPDVVLLDMRLPDVDGATAAGRIRAIAPNVKILIFTAGAAPNDVQKTLAAGASGIILKTAPLADLVDAITRTEAGEQVIDPDAGVLVEPVDDRGMSEREIEVLGLMAAGMTNKEIATHLFIAQPTVKTHVERILRKLDVSDRADAVAEAHRLGIIADRRR